ncbi:SAE2-domain-containing protein [Hypoxylon sp. NC1633]|nr:SAE2-domain-containing protein [Hypoxylon sp. NC1633]
MGDWFDEKGRDALFDALGQAIDRVGYDLDKYLRDENAPLYAELESLKSRVSHVDRLEEEARTLKSELQTLKEASHADAFTTDPTRSHSDTRDTRTPLAPKSANRVSNPKRLIKPGILEVEGIKYSELNKEYLKLDGNHTKLRKKYSELEDAHATLIKHLRAMKTTAEHWRDQATQFEQKYQVRGQRIKKLEASLKATAAAASGSFDASFSSDISSDTSLRPPNRQQIDPFRSREPGLARPVSIQRETPSIRPPTNFDGTDPESLKSTPSSTRTRVNSEPQASREKDIEPDPQDRQASLPPLPQNQSIGPVKVLVKDEPSSDSPVIVSERCLRKRKRNDRQSEDIRVSPKAKTEDGSDPLIIDERHHFVPYESIDFDAEAVRVETPRKRNRTNPEPGGEAEASPSHTDRSRSTLREGDTVRDATRHSGSPTRPLHGEDPKFAYTNERATAPSLEVRFDRSSALRPLDSTLRQKLELQNYSVKKRTPFPRRDAVADLAEDGDGYETPSATVTKKPGTGRLQNLLDRPSPGLEAIIPSPGTQPGHLSALKRSEFQIPKRRELPFGPKTVGHSLQSQDTPEALSKQASAKSNATQLPAQRGIGAVPGNPRPLRERPKSQLGINDFKVNPLANDGYDYAFTDVVRNKGERASLTGCVQETCCGQAFRLQARAKRDQTSALDFQTALEKYLGDDAWKLSTMDRPEKEELWLKAKIHELANEHGKHRHRFHRATSPAGFWRTDFPSTQEDQRDKEEADKMTRQMVDERYREAMRPGGRWLFRDE